MTHPGRRYAWAPYAVLAVALLHAAAGWFLRPPGMVWGEDDAAYLLLAKELRHFSYREVQDVAAPMHARFPPLFPLMLAVVGWPFGDHLDALLVLVALCSAASIVIAFDGARRTFGDDVALPMALLLALSPSALWMGGNLMAEAPFVLFTMLALWGVAREDESPRFALIAGVAAYLAALTRTAGIVFVAALFCYWIVRRRYARAAWFSSVGVLTLGIWLAWTFMAPDAENRRLYVADLGLKGGSGFSFLGEMAARIPGRVRLLLRDYIPTALSVPTIPGTSADNVVWAIVLVATAGAGAVALWRRWMAVLAFLVPYLLLLLVWRYQTGRFLTPIVPLLLIVTLGGGTWIAERVQERWGRSGRWIVPALVLALGIGALMRDGVRVANVRACDRENPLASPACYSTAERDALRAAYWVRDSTAVDDVFLVSKERAFFVHSGRRSINQDRALRESPDSLASYLRSRHVRYAVVSPIGVYAWSYNALVAQACRDFAVVRQFSAETVLLRVRDAGENRDDLTACRALDAWHPGSKPSR
ncbi:MAG: glycosyltransferase family 39 protein [Gemmatimonadaceae bacterium]